MSIKTTKKIPSKSTPKNRSLPPLFLGLITLNNPKQINFLPSLIPRARRPLILNSQQLKRQQLVTSDQPFPTLFASSPHLYHPIPLPNPQRPPKPKNPLQAHLLPQSTNHKSHLPTPFAIQTLKTPTTHIQPAKNTPLPQTPAPTQSTKCFPI